MSSSLAGRFIEFFLLPFSFSEFLLYINRLPDTRIEFLRNKVETQMLFEEYLKTGGLHETFDIPGIESQLGFILSSPGQIVSFASIKMLFNNKKRRRPSQ